MTCGFWETLHGNSIYSQGFCQKYAEVVEEIFFLWITFCWRCLDLWILRNFAWQFYLFSEFLPEICWSRRRNIFFLDYVLLEMSCAVDFEKLHGNSIYSQSFCKKSPEVVEEIFFLWITFCWKCLDLWILRNFARQFYLLSGFCQKSAEFAEEIFFLCTYFVLLEMSWPVDFEKLCTAILFTFSVFASNLLKSSKKYFFFGLRFVGDVLTCGFWETLHGNSIYSQGFCQKSAEVVKEIFFLRITFCWRCLDLWILRNLAWQFYLFSEFLPEICWEKVAEEKNFSLDYVLLKMFWPAVWSEASHIISQYTTSRLPREIDKNRNSWIYSSERQSKCIFFQSILLVS